MLIAIILSLGLQGAPSDTVSLSLAEAIGHAALHNPALRAEEAQARAVGQNRLEATRAFLPTIRAEVQAMRTTDPVGVFGMKLRQGSFTQSDFTLPALNDPSPFSGFSSSLTLELPLLAPEGLFAYAAATHADRASEAGVARAHEATAFMVEQGYWSAQLATLRVRVLDAALEAAFGHVRQAEALLDQGLVTGLDARLAALHHAGLEVRRLGAAADAANARDRLLALVALPSGTALRFTESLETIEATSPPGTLPGAQTSAGAKEDPSLERSDLRALRAGVEASRAAHRSARAAQFPQFFAFGSVVQHATDSPWSGGSGDWAVGVGVRWNVFPGLSGFAAVRRAGAEAASATARFEDASRRALVELLETQRMRTAAIEGLAVSERANAEAAVALDQARLRYRSGQSPVTELLDVQRAATEAALMLATAKHDVLIADAAVRFANGADVAVDNQGVNR